MIDPITEYILNESGDQAKLLLAKKKQVYKTYQSLVKRKALVCQDKNSPQCKQVETHIASLSRTLGHIKNTLKAQGKV